MAVMLEYSSWLELKLKKALLEEGIQFEEQHRVYEKMTDLRIIFSGSAKHTQEHMILSVISLLLQQVRNHCL